VVSEVAVVAPIGVAVVVLVVVVVVVEELVPPVVMMVPLVGGADTIIGAAIIGDNEGTVSAVGIGSCIIIIGAGDVGVVVFPASIITEAVVGIVALVPPETVPPMVGGENMIGTTITGDDAEGTMPVVGIVAVIIMGAGVTVVALVPPPVVIVMVLVLLVVVNDDVRAS
jgi:hypothetical protein